MKTNVNGKEVNATISEIFQIMWVGKTQNDAKVTVVTRGDLREIHIHNREFFSFEDAINYLSEDQRNIVAPENRATKIELELVA